MAKSTDIRLDEISLAVTSYRFRAPLKFGGRVVTDNDVLNVRAEARTQSGRVGVGYGSMPVGSVWAWPAGKVSAEDAAKAVKLLCQRIVELAGELKEFEHPLDLVHQIQPHYRRLADAVVAELKLAEPIPDLAVLLAASPVDAALHDAFGKANEINSFNGLGREFVRHDLSHYLGSEFQGEYLDAYTLRTPKPRMPLYHLVGALDPLTTTDVKQPINDGLPESLDEWIRFNGLNSLKIKLNGDDLRWDVDRVVAVHRVATLARPGFTGWRYSLDFNEKCADVAYVLAFLAQIRERAPQGFDFVQYIEQPTHRDLSRFASGAMAPAAKIKPVVIDESLVSYASLLQARDVGYTGVALKACKGQTEALLMAAAAQKHRLFLCVQDLTCTGFSFLHSAALSARFGAVQAIEGNGRQYCPSGNQGWEERFPSMFRITDGMLGSSALDGPGLGGF